ncbi:hypothetical protein O181_121399 [Austropuccinia psidii MF-1]|uniref:Uncharacterized protein n=1 Tax=Austropuccinia psidii MF-1 TaxID=1389203 RepID=A0A9Q3KIK6_9BASI|nr:hypothetical protein [Austropuccinia psidii MF-1]
MILTLLLGPQDERMMPPPISPLTTPYTSSPHHLQSLRSRETTSAMAKTPGNSTKFNKLPTSAPESGSEMSDMASSRELGIEVESQSHKDNQDPPVLPECEYASILNISNFSKSDIVS